MAAVYKLQYFDFMGLAEPIRYLLSYGGTPFENIFVKMDVDWPMVKKTVPFGKLPVLQFKGKMLFQSVAISRFLASEFELMPKDEITAAEMDGIVQTVYDLYMKVQEWFSEGDKAKKTSMHSYLDTELFPTVLTYMEEWITERGGYFAGKQLSWADLFFVGIFESVEGMYGSLMLRTSYPGLHALHTRVHALPEIKAYIAKRPKYKY